MKKKRLLKRNDYLKFGHTAFMPSGVMITINPDNEGVDMYYPDHRSNVPVVKRFIKDTWYNDVNTNCL